jgi:hypothetical protein
MPRTTVVEAFSVQNAQICDGTNGFLTNLAAQLAVGTDIYGVNDASLAADTGSYENQGDNQTLSRWNWLNFGTVTVQGGYLSFPLYSTLSGQAMATTNVSAASEVQTISSNGSSAGTFSLTFRGATASGIAFSATSAVVQTALQGLSTIGAGNVTVTGGPANTTALVLTFGGTLANTPLELIQVNTAGLTGATGGIPSRTTPGAFADTYYGIDLWHEDSMNVSAKPLLLTLPSKDNLGAVCRLIIGLYKCQFGPIGFDGPSFKDGFKVNYEATALMSSTDELGVAFADGKKRIGRLISIL